MADDDARKRFARKIVERSGDLPSLLIEAVAQGLFDLPAEASEEERLSVAAKVAGGSARGQVANLIKLWNKHVPELRPESIALALQAVAEKEHEHRKSQSLDLVWSGPTTEGTTLRRTDQALYELINGARDSITIVTYVAYKVPKVKEALFNASERGVHISLILRSEEDEEGDVQVASLKALGRELPKSADIYIWPEEKKEEYSGKKAGIIHAKCAFADDNVLLVSSANLTEYALSVNMEMGILVRGGRLPFEAAQHFRKLIQQGDLEKL